MELLTQHYPYTTKALYTSYHKDLELNLMLVRYTIYADLKVLSSGTSYLSKKYLLSSSGFFFLKAPG